MILAFHNKSKLNYFEKVEFTNMSGFKFEGCSLDDKVKTIRLAPGEKGFINIVFNGKDEPLKLAYKILHRLGWYDY